MYDFQMNQGRVTARRRRSEPAVVFVEPRATGVTTVLWIVHGGTLLRSAPEHLRLTSRLATDVSRAIGDMTGQFVDLEEKAYHF